MKLVNVNFYDLKKISETKKIVCFGAGRNLTNYLNENDKTDFLEQISIVLDNSESKNGTFLNVKNRNIPVMSVAEFVKLGKKNCFLVISCLEAYSIYEQLDKLEFFDEISCGVLNFIKAATNEYDAKRRFYPSDFKISTTPKIPKKIHYCWFGGKELPEKNREWINTWKKYCPDYEIIEWNESNYDYKKNEFMYEAYKAKKWGFVPDYARLDIIYNHGGIYLDTDVEIIRTIDDLLYQDAFAGVDGTNKISLGLGFGAVKNHKMIGELMEMYSNIHFDRENMIAAPIFEKSFFEQKGYLSNGEYQLIENMTIYPEKVLSGKCIFTGAVLPTDKTFTIHHYDASWKDKDIQGRRERERDIFMEMMSKN